MEDLSLSLILCKSGVGTIFEFSEVYVDVWKYKLMLFKHMKREVNTGKFLDYALSFCSVCRRCLFSFHSGVCFLYFEAFFADRRKIARLTYI